VSYEAAADAEDEILVCVAGIVGRAISGENDLSAEELARVRDECLAEDEQEGGRGIPDEKDGRDLPPDDVLECIIRVPGVVPTGSISQADKDLLDKSCGTSDEGSDDGTKDDGGGDPSDGRSNESDARKIAFCESNRSDPHCEGFDPSFNPDDLDFDSSTPWAGGAGGGKDAPSQDFTEGDPDTNEGDLKSLCELKPEDAKCSGSGDSGGTKDDGGGATETKAGGK